MVRGTCLPIMRSTFRSKSSRTGMVRLDLSSECAHPHEPAILPGGLSP